MQAAQRIWECEFTEELSVTTAKPRFLSDVLKIKKDRGDQDCARFISAASQFWAKLGATVEGAYRTARLNNMNRFADMLEEFV